MSSITSDIKNITSGPLALSGLLTKTERQDHALANPSAPSQRAFLPGQLTDGIEESDDPMIGIRTGAYALSFLAQSVIGRTAMTSPRRGSASGPLLAQSGHSTATINVRFRGVKRTSHGPSAQRVSTPLVRSCLWVDAWVAHIHGYDHKSDQ
jgi:hypothetical protein